MLGSAYFYYLKLISREIISQVFQLCDHDSRHLNVTTLHMDGRTDDLVWVWHNRALRIIARKKRCANEKLKRVLILLQNKT